MFRWNDVEVNSSTGQKMYREIDRDVEYSEIELDSPLDLDHIAYKFLQSELYLYKILDLNFIDFMECRGDMNVLKKIKVPKA